MKVNILASGSQGNCIAITSEKKTILIDAGVAKTKIENRLLEVGIIPKNIEAIYITHAHNDHTKGLPLANKYRIPVCAGEDEWKDIDIVDEELRRSIRPGEVHKLIFLFKIVAFATHHDAFSPIGYMVEEFETGERCSVCLDTGKVDEAMLQAMQGADTYIIEANHEPRMVEASDYPISVQARILSDVGHLSNEQTAEALSKLVQGKGEQIYLTHLSSNNNMPALAEMTVTRELQKKGFKKDKHYRIEVV